MSGNRVRPTNSFIEFKKEDIEQSIPERFEQMVEKYPDRLAVRDQIYQWTYRELNQASNRLAWAIIQKTPDDRVPVGVFLKQGVSMVTALLATLKAGKIYVPLDPFFATSRVTSILKDLNAKLIVTDEASLHAGRNLSPGGIEFLVCNDIFDGSGVENPPHSNSPDSLASILYTSGSTGEPKGVIHNHRNLLHMTMSYTNPLHIEYEERISLLFTPTVISAIRSAFLALLNGAALFPYEIRESGLSHLKNWLNRDQITLSHWAATVFRQFILGLQEGDSFPHHRLLWVGGEPVYRKDVAAYQKHFPRQCLFMNALGITEAGNVCLYLMNQLTPISGNVVPVGHAVEGAEILLLDNDRQEVPAGGIGEIAVRSSNLSTGYWGRPDLTELNFFKDPGEPGKRVYLTGDLGRMTATNCLLHLGRKDLQVKIRGFRVEIPEIESALLEISNVREAVVTAHSDPSGEGRLVAYIVPSTDPPPPIHALRRILSKAFPDYMIPFAFIVLETLPLTSSGKVDRQALPPPESERPGLEIPYSPPSNEIEEELVKIWGEALGLDQVGVNDPFLELGGDSLRATQIISRILDKFQVDIPMQDLMESSTIAEMTEAILNYQSSQIEPDEMERLLDEMESTSSND